ncbi:hypothetical protein JKF63_02420 [Porcisia hertigi]|uniref:SRCR domain-containing protein n=1 Tax=Porcisia hertigi TaxID=2761500 RepID=A0A836HR64_9TRYP|nr:hypothetical protein JKF63_02420 [Porcisia hertigi]
MPPRLLTYQAKPYVPVTSAAIDPFEEGEGSLVDDDRLDSWLRYVEAELQRYRSPFVAAEALLTEMRRCSQGLYHPERLYISTALQVLQACVPHLSKETAQVLQAAVHELLPCLVYTRRTPLTNSLSAPLSSRGIEKVTRQTYAGAFRLLSTRWEQCQGRLQRLERHARIEERLVDRLVHGLDGLWVTVCFYSWRTFCRRLRVRKAQLQRRLRQAAASEVAPSFLRVWRQYARKIALKAKISMNDIIHKQVEELYPLEQEAKNCYDHLFEEIKEKNRLVRESLQRLEETQNRSKVLEDLIAETDASLTDHWRTWKKCTQLMFDDVGVLPDRVGERRHHEYVMNITDTALDLSKRARGRTDRIGMRHIAELLLFQGEFDPDDEAKAGGRAGGAASLVSRIGSSFAASRPVSHFAAGSAVPVTSESPSGLDMAAASVKKTVRPMPLRGPVVNQTFLAASLASEVSRVYWSVAAVARPVVMPLHLMDVLHHNEAYLNITLTFLSTVYSGGHCSVFVPVIEAEEGATSSCLPLLSNKAFGEVSPASAPKVMNDGKSAAPEEVEWGSIMMQDVMSGMAKVQDCADSNEGYLLAVRGGMTMKEMDSVHGYLEELYTRWSAAGLPLSQQKLEAAWSLIVKPEKLPIINALYPTNGVTCFSELIHYVTRVAEFSGCSLQGLAERLDVTYQNDLVDDLRVIRNSEGALGLFREYAAHFATLLEWLKDDTDSSQYNYDHLSVLLKHQFGLSQEDSAEVSRYARIESGQVVNSDDIEWLLLFAAPYVDPSPFTPLLEKIASMLEDCTPFFRQLSMQATKPRQGAR